MKFLTAEKCLPRSIAVVTILLTSAALASAGTYSFQTLDNPGDPAFNQLLGINNAGVIAGYFGDGTTVPNNGYTLSGGVYTPENFPGAAQTQVVAINNVLNSGAYNTAGFYVDNTGANHGFSNMGGTFTTVDNALTTSTPAFNQLLGLNDHNVAVGFYQDSAMNFHGYEVDLTTNTFTPITLPGGLNATSVTAAGVNNGGVISGFYTNTSGAVHGFIDNGGTFTSYDDPNGNGTNTSFFGLNNKGQVVGSYVDANGTNGLLFNYLTNTWQTIDDPKQSFSTAFGVNGTTVNGINDMGQLVGFYSDGTNVNGFLATATPEPASLGLVGLSALGLGLIWRKKQRRG